MRMLHADRILPLVGPITLLIFWEAATTAGWADPLLLPTPGATARRLAEITADGSLLADLIPTVTRWLGGYSAGCIVGVPAGLLMGASRTVYSATSFLLEFFRSLPVTALFPLFLLIFGLDTSKVVMVFTATVTVVILNSAYGVFHKTEARVRMARTFGATWVQTFTRITFSEAMPQVLVGVRTALSQSLIVIIVAEMFIGSDRGLGQRVFDAYSRNSVTELYAVLLVIGMIGFLSNKVFVLAEHRIIDWAGE